MDAEQKLKDLLTSLEGATFAGKDMTGFPLKVEYEYSPDRLKIASKDTKDGSASTLEMELKGYDRVIAATEDADGQQTVFSGKELQAYEMAGLWADFMMGDPRCVLQDIRGAKELKPNVYELIVDSCSLDPAEMVLGVTVYTEVIAELHLDGNDDLKKMKVRRIYRDGTETLAKKIDF